MTVLPSSAQGPDVASLGRARSADEAPLLAEFNALYKEQFPYVWRSLRRLGVDERDREDAANKVLFAVYQRLAERDTARAVKPWIFAFAARVASDYRRLARHRREILGQELIDTAASNPKDTDDGEARQLVLLALDRLEIDKRAVLILHDLDEQTIPEIAMALSIPVNTAYSRLRVAREEFTIAVRRLEGGARGR